VNAAEVLVRCLENEGVTYIFGIPGEETLDLIEAIRHSSIRFITVRHEQGAAFMADMYGRQTGKAGVCLSTLGPGATNLVTGVADANSDGAPLIAITGQVGTERMHLTSHQYLDLEKMFGPITKRCKQIVQPDSVNEIVRIAFKYAENEKPGAVLIDLPCNVAKMDVTPGLAQTPLKHHEYNREFASVENLEKAAGMIFQARNPIILAGHSAVRSHAAEALTAFARQLKLPDVNTIMAKVIIIRPATAPIPCIPSASPRKTTPTLPSTKPTWSSPSATTSLSMPRENGIWAAITPLSISIRALRISTCFISRTWKSWGIFPIRCSRSPSGAAGPQSPKRR
jgi:acetolactate synthase-1/2/3 large subunit